MQAVHTMTTRVWRTALVLIVAATIMVAGSLTFTGTASATVINGNNIACPAIYPAPSWCGGNNYTQWRTAYASFKDWGRVRGNDYVCFRAPCGVQSYTAWQLYNGRFYQTSLRAGAEIYIWPYGYGYSWVWTNRTGWLVMSTSDLQYRAPGMRVMF